VEREFVNRSRGIRRLVLAGGTTSGVVLSTLRQAADLDYELVVLADGGADGDQHVHDVLIKDVFPAHADIVSIDAWTAAIAASHPTAEHGCAPGVAGAEGSGAIQPSAAPNAPSTRPHRAHAPD
jgi:hypothetical protein